MVGVGIGYLCTPRTSKVLCNASVTVVLIPFVVSSAVKYFRLSLTETNAFVRLLDKPLLVSFLVSPDSAYPTKGLT